MPRPFIQELRNGTYYPAFRGVTNLFSVVLYVLAALLAVAAVVAGFGRGGVAALVGGLITAVLLYLVGRVSKEAATMVADLSDAAVYLAERSKASD